MECSAGGEVKPNRGATESAIVFLCEHRGKNSTPPKKANWESSKFAIPCMDLYWQSLWCLHGRRGNFCWKKYVTEKRGLQSSQWELVQTEPPNNFRELFTEHKYRRWEENRTKTNKQTTTTKTQQQQKTTKSSKSKGTTKIKKQGS